VIPNKRGTAPGMWFDQNEKIFVSMPGVPHEMKGMMEDYVIPHIQKRFELTPILHRTLLTAGIGESFLAELLISFEAHLPSEIKIAYLPNYGMVRIRLTNADDRAQEKLDTCFENLKILVKDYLVVDRDISMQEYVAEQLLASKKTLAIAESCTGGYISHLITSIPGSSRFYLGGITSYANDVKENILNVPKSILLEKGAVSEEVAQKMAEGARLKTGADYGISTTGIMGPDGGSVEKPVGMVCMGFSSKDKTISAVFQFRFDRKRNIELAAIHALDFLRKNMG
jgi:nicotinamide-nucleotide amidase